MGQFTALLQMVKQRVWPSNVLSFAAEKSLICEIDTHKDNRPMQAAIRKFGFQECGVIYVADGSSRLAFDYYHVVG